MNILCKLFGWFCPKPPVPPTPPPPANGFRAIGVIVSNEADQRIAGASVTLQDTTTTFQTATTDASGYAEFASIPATLQNTQLKVEAEKYVTVDQSIVLTPNINQQVWLGGEPEQSSALRLPALKLSAPPRRTQEELTFVLTSFCNLRDSQNRVIFAPMIAMFDETVQDDWLAKTREDGGTHFVVSPYADYHGTGFNWLNEPEKFVALVRKVLATPAADGKGFTPILILDSGNQPGFRDRFTQSYSQVKALLGEDEKDCIVVPGWELITASDIKSVDMSWALETLKGQGWTHIWVHLSPRRAAMSSNPIEPDDPWQGGESECWKSHGGQYAEGFLYQSEAVRPGDENCNASLEECWLNRWEDVVPRIGKGMNGWRVMPLVYFEGPAYFYYRGQSDSAFAVTIAEKAKAMADKYGVKVGFGNGIPTAYKR